MDVGGADAVEEVGSRLGNNEIRKEGKGFKHI